MPIVGVICPVDGSYQPFEFCIQCHQERDKSRPCHAPIFALKSMRDNHIHRVGAGISVSTLLSCPREVALTERYDVYEHVMSGYNKARGSYTHAMIEADQDPPDWIIRERRLYLDILGVRVTGQPDEVDTKYHVLVDYKSKDNLPLKPDPSHEYQFNAYAYLLRHGYWMDTNEKANIDIKVIGAHYLTWKTKIDKAWKKKPYPVWSDERMERALHERLQPLIEWRESGILPQCNPYQTFPGRWVCHCNKIEDQLKDRGIDVYADAQ